MIHKSALHGAALFVRRSHNLALGWLGTGLTSACHVDTRLFGGRLMDQRIPVTAAVPSAESTVDGGGPISHADVAEEILQAIKRKAAGERDVPPLGLVVQGGGMRGVYSLAVLAAFEEMGWTRCFD